MFAKLIGNPWFGVGVIFVWLASLAYVGYWQRGEGRALEQNKWQKGYIQAQTLYSAKLEQLNTDARAIENKRAVEAAANDKKLLDERNQYERDAKFKIDRAVDMYQQLRDQYANNRDAGRSGTCQTSSDSGRASNGEGRELSRQSSDFLLAEAKRADGTVMLLNRCIRQLKSDREISQ